MTKLYRSEHLRGAAWRCNVSAMTTATVQKITARKHASIVASLRDQRLDVHIGIITLAQYHTRVDETVAFLAELGAAPLPVEIVKWAR